jgi:hypothetical protein
VVFSTNKTACHDIAEILLKVTLNTIKQTKQTYLVMAGSFIGGENHRPVASH